MEISMLMNTQTLCDEIVNGQMDGTVQILDQLESFDMEYIMDTENIGNLYELLLKNRREQACREFSMFLDRNRERSKKRIDQQNFDERNNELKELMKKESCDIRAILYHNAVFYTKEHMLALGESESLRVIACSDDLCRVLSVLGQDIDELHEFSQYIQNVYDNITFDSEIENSMRKLEAGFKTRRHEILYHLFFINREVPEIINKYGQLDNSSLGDKMSVPCSPERDRTIVKNKLTKMADDGKKIKCELHTKMETIGSNKPDRIYFCASVSDQVKINNVDLTGRIYVYKITEHV